MDYLLLLTPRSHYIDIHLTNNLAFYIVLHIAILAAVVEGLVTL